VRAILAIAKKDFKSLMTSPVFYVVAGFFTALISYFYMRAVFQFAEKAQYAGGMPGGPQPNIHLEVFANMLNMVHILLLFTVPVLSMRALAEEKKVRTYDLLLTSPIKAFDIAVGKFLAVFGIVLMLLALAFVYPLATNLFAEFNMAQVYTSFLGMALLVGVYVGISLFASALTSSVFLAAFLGIVMILGFMFMGQGGASLDNPFWSSIFEHISVDKQYGSFILGSVEISSIVFFVSSIALFVFLSERVIESSRWR
jgi:ABC-2 type transport system permease protein